MSLPVNFVANPGFEDDPVSNIQGGAWALNIWGEGPNLPADPFFIDTVDVYEGIRALKCSVTDPAGNQFVVGQQTSVAKGVLDPSDFVVGETYTLQIAYKSDVDLRVLFQASALGVKKIREAWDIPASAVYTLTPAFDIVWPDAGIDYIQWFILLNNQVGTFLVDAASLMGVLAPTPYTLTISAVGSGSTVPTPGSYTYNEGDSVTVTAIPDEGFNFLNWRYYGVEYDVNPLSFTIDGDINLQAIFESPVVKAGFPWKIPVVSTVIVSVVTLLKRKK